MHYHSDPGPMIALIFLLPVLFFGWIFLMANTGKRKEQRLANREDQRQRVAQRRAAQQGIYGELVPEGTPREESVFPHPGIPTPVDAYSGAVNIPQLLREKLGPSQNRGVPPDVPQMTYLWGDPMNDDDHTSRLYLALSKSERVKIKKNGAELTLTRRNTFTHNPGARKHKSFATERSRIRNRRYLERPSQNAPQNRSRLPYVEETYDNY